MVVKRSRKATRIPRSDTVFRRQLPASSSRARLLFGQNLGHTITPVLFRPSPSGESSVDVMALNNEDGKYTGSEMEYTYGDAKQKMQSRTDDLAILLRKLPSHAMSLAYDFVNNRHHPSKNVRIACRPNKAILTWGWIQEELTEIAGMLPYNSPLRNTAQAHTVSMLFNSLEHPPASYLGHEHQYRTADASHHVRMALFHLTMLSLHLPSCTSFSPGV